VGWCAASERARATPDDTVLDLKQSLLPHAFDEPCRAGCFGPVEVGACVPRAPKKLMDPRPNRPIVLHSADVYVDRNGIVYCTDWSGAGLHIMEYTG